MSSEHFHGNEPFGLPIKYDIQENHIRLGAFGATYSIPWLPAWCLR